ncbi:MAG: hypothetical protein V1746_01720 [bacterium]
MKKAVAIFIIIFALGVGLFFLTPGSLKKEKLPPPVVENKSEQDNAAAALNPLLALVQSNEKMLESLNKAFTSLAADIKSSTARLSIKDANDKTTRNWSVILSSGTQAIAPGKGLKGAKSITVALKEATVEAELAGMDEKNGLALLNLKQAISVPPLIWQNDCQAGEGILLLVWGEEAAKPWVIPSWCVGRGAVPQDLAFYASGLAMDALLFDLRGRLVGCYFKLENQQPAAPVAIAIGENQITQIVNTLTQEKSAKPSQP